MKIEGIVFVEDNIKKMKKKAFIDSIENVHFLDRPKEKRREILSDIYDKIKGVSNSKVESISGGGGL